MSLKDGVTHKKGFKPEESSPASTKVGGRPKHDNDKIKRKVSKTKC